MNEQKQVPAWQPLFMVVMVVVLALVTVSAVMSATNARLNFPVVSQVVCSLKGDTWYGGGIMGTPGCYAPE